MSVQQRPKYAGVTTAAIGFHKMGLIEYHRGELKVLDHDGLKALACSCYEADKLLFSELMSLKT